MNPFWRSYFSDGLVQPPTSCGIWIAFFSKAECLIIAAIHWVIGTSIRFKHGSGTSKISHVSSCDIDPFQLVGQIFLNQQLLVSQKDWLQTSGLLFLEGILTTLKRDSSPFHCRNLYQWTRSLIVSGGMKKSFYPPQKCLRNFSSIFAQHCRKMYCHSYCLLFLYYLLIVLFVDIIICDFFICYSSFI